MMASFSYRYPRSERGIEVHDLILNEEPTLLLGINGAGKTTLLRLLSGELRPTNGTVPGTEGIVYVPQKFTPIRGFTTCDYVSYVAWLHGRSRMQAGKDARNWIDFVGLSQEFDQDCRHLSGGQQSKLQLAAGLNAGGRQLLLDEPSTSLDPIAKSELQHLYSKIIADGVGLWVSTHQPHEVAEPFARVVVLNQGRIIFVGNLTEFSNQADRTDVPPILSELARVTR